MFSHIHLGTTDFDRALAFYEPLARALGLVPRFNEPARGRITTPTTTAPTFATRTATSWRWPAMPRQPEVHFDLN